ncbi:DUF3299 domain-containing protein [Cupriavidus agavae]|uniref:DUF3299 domain-containing protein n=1 Tax=Cupriavidus agavae TaxID=1001822 RepID=A0A4Q7RZT2_9BURK|nr:DUF3299 domain-containing protein [Cupriavidus agavae]RZT39406.1 hypothetical protein EV147_2601 [Cupriavidus agavae]
MNRRTFLSQATALPLVPLVPSFARAADGYPGLAWPELIPPGWDPGKPLEGLNLDELSDDDPRARQALERARAYWKQAPVNRAVEGRRVTLRGFVVPMAGQITVVREFLLVAYYGACIHTPPPPANQVVHVRMDEPMMRRLRVMNRVAVSGVLRVQSFSSVMGDAGYALQGASVVVL